MRHEEDQGRDLAVLKAPQDVLNLRVLDWDMQIEDGDLGL